jgi:hypothetical protein
MGNECACQCGDEKQKELDVQEVSINPEETDIKINFAFNSCACF